MPLINFDQNMTKELMNTLNQPVSTGTDVTNGMLLVFFVIILALVYHYEN